jgi:hypothetical protein
MGKYWYDGILWGPIGENGPWTLSLLHWCFHHHPNKPMKFDSSKYHLDSINSSRYYYCFFTSRKEWNRISLDILQIEGDIQNLLYNASLARPWNWLHQQRTYVKQIAKVKVHTMIRVMEFQIKLTWECVFTRVVFCQWALPLLIWGKKQNKLTSSVIYLSEWFFSFEYAEWSLSILHKPQMCYVCY